MNRYLATSLLATMTGAVLVFVAHGCAINSLASCDFDCGTEIVKAELGRSSSSASGGRGGAGGAGGTAGAGGATGCTCTDDGNACTDDSVGDACPGGKDKGCHTVVANRSCTQNDNKPGYCDDAGACKSCDECSDAACMKRCNGQVCQTPDVCVSGNCVDGFCCDSDCMGECNACNRVPGTCQPLPVGMAGECKGGKLCSKTGDCTVMGAPLGSLCNSSAACASGICNPQTCVSTNGEPCVEDLECDSRLCDPTTHKCVACEPGMQQCPGGATCLPNGRCPVLLGQPAANTNECAFMGTVGDGLTCTLPVDEMCTNDSECIYHSCIGSPGKCAKACTIPQECPSGTTCNVGKGWCRLLPGSYCVVDDQCQSATCSGFPRKCQ